MSSQLKKAFIVVMAIVAVAVILRVFVINIVYVPTNSMSPAINSGDVVFVLRFPYFFKEPQRGDIVVFKNEKMPMIKRVVGVGGDKIRLVRGNLYRNGHYVIEEYVKNQGIDTTEEFIVPKNGCLVLGDNRTNSNDSRNFENPSVDNEKIIGKAWFKIGFFK